MILYLDTSALVKLYVAEPGSELVHGKVSSSEVVSTSVVAYPETMSALQRAHRNDRLSEENYRNLADRVHREWDSFLEVQVDQDLKERAGDLVQREGLRGFDSIHLASALTVHGEVESMKFACFDDRLRAAAKSQGLDCIGE